MPSNSEGLPGTHSKWTVLVYICSDNNLQDESYYDVKEMELAGSTQDVRTVIQWDRSGEDSYVKFSGCQRYLIRKSDGSPEIQSQMLENLGVVDMGSPNALADFVTWGIKEFPSDKYALILWDHGSGWKDLESRLETRGISYDSGSGNHLSQVDLRNALEKSLNNTGVKLDVIGMDACLMGSIEVAYDLKDYANYCVFSEVTVPGSGWPYDTVLSELIRTPSFEGMDFAKLSVYKYEEDYADQQGTTLSAIDLSKISNLTDAVNQLANSTISMSDQDKIQLLNIGLSSQKADSGGYSDFHDLGDFAKLINTQLSDSSIKSDATAISAALQATVIAEYHDPTFPGATGLTIWIPNETQYLSGISTYRTLLFSTFTNWDELLESTMSIP
jgi:hypothetical protein